MGVPDQEVKSVGGIFLFHT